MNKRLHTLLLVATVAVMLSCAIPPAASSPVLTATIEAAQTEAVSTAVMQMTFDAILHPSATVTQPPQTATATQPPLPSDTPTALPSNTQQIITLPPTVMISPIPSRTPTRYRTNTPANTLCRVLELTPDSKAKLTPGVDFDGRWVVQNISDDTWHEEKVDLVYISGTKFQEFEDDYDLRKDVKPNGKITLIVDMLAPRDPGRYTATWALVSGSHRLCTFGLSITVVESESE